MKPDPNRQIFAWCSELPGFGVRLTPAGSASFLLDYCNADGDRRRMVLGKMGALTVDQARQLARERLAMVATGVDPLAARMDARRALTIADLCDQYLEAAQAGLVVTRFRRPKKASTIAIDVGRVARHIKPLIGSIRAGKLVRADVQRMADAIAQGKTAGTFDGDKPRSKAVVSGGTGTAARVVELLGGIWSWAEKRGFVEGSNPAHGVETVRGEPNDRVLTAHELHALGRVLTDQAPLYPAAVAALRLIALTGLRREEAVGLRWSEIDALGSCLRLEASKTGKSVRPVSGLVLDLLRDVQRGPSDFVFPCRDGSAPADLKRTIGKLFDAAGLSDARSHDLRRTFATEAAEAGYSDATIGELLGHAARAVTARHYIRRPDAALIAAADAVAQRIARALEGGAELAPVVPLPVKRRGK